MTTTSGIRDGFSLTLSRKLARVECGLWSRWWRLGSVQRTYEDLKDKYIYSQTPACEGWCWVWCAQNPGNWIPQQCSRQNRSYLRHKWMHQDHAK